jgi:hypothetical protein
VIRTGSCLVRLAVSAEFAPGDGWWVAVPGSVPTSTPNRGADGCSWITIDQSPISWTPMSKPT